MSILWPDKNHKDICRFTVLQKPLKRNVGNTTTRSCSDHDKYKATYKVCSETSHKSGTSKGSRRTTQDNARP